MGGSVLIVEYPENRAQLGLLFVDDSVCGVGLGRWLVEESVRYTREVGFDSVYLWTVVGLGRAIAIYESVEFIRTAEKTMEAWGKDSLEIRYD